MALKFLKITLFSAIIIACLTFANNSFAQSRDNNKSCFPSREAILNQRIAFISQKLQLTTKEAEKFWPIYNSTIEKIHNAHKASSKSLKVLNDALADDNSSDSDIKALSDAYLNCKATEHSIYAKLYEDISEILPAKKAAKIFQAEEDFRVMLIKQLKQCQKQNKKD